MLLARYADRVVKLRRELGQTEYTVKDFLDTLKINPNASEGMDGAELMQAAAMRQENKRYVLNSDGNLDWGNIAEDITADDGTVVKAAPIRMQVGFQVGANKAGNGYVHILHKHGSYISKKHQNVATAVKNILNNVSFILVDGDRVSLVSDNTPHTSTLLTMDLVYDESTGEEFYAINSLMPQSTTQVKKSKQKALLFAGRQIPAPITGDGSERTPASSVTAGTPGGLLPHKNSAFSTVSLSNVDEYVKKFTYDDNTFNQSAWHGSPHEFDGFDLGAIGTGAGAQAHGWGLYFAKDKKIAEGYKENLT